MKNIKKNKLTVSKDFSAREAGVLLESMDKKIDLLIDAQADNIERFNNIDQRFDNLHKEMDYKFDVTFDELHAIRTALKGKVSRDELAVVEGRVAEIEKRD